MDDFVVANIPILKPIKVYVDRGIKQNLYKLRIQEITPSNKCTYKIYTVIVNSDIIPVSESKFGNKVEVEDEIYDFVDVELQNIPCIVNKRLRGAY